MRKARAWTAALAVAAVALLAFAGTAQALPAGFWGVVAQAAPSEDANKRQSRKRHHKEAREEQEILSKTTIQKTEGRKHKSGKKNKRHVPIDVKAPYARENLKGEKILQPELTPLRITFNAYKDFCAKTSKVKRKTYTFLKNKPQAKEEY